MKRWIVAVTYETWDGHTVTMARKAFRFRWVAAVWLWWAKKEMGDAYPSRPLVSAEVVDGIIWGAVVRLRGHYGKSFARRRGTFD